MWRTWSASKIAERHKILDRCIHHDPVLRDIHRLYQLLDGKSAALFSHVSIMIAACTFLAGSPFSTASADGPNNLQLLEKIVFLLSTLIYLCIAINMLKVLDFNMYDVKIETLHPEIFLNRPSGDIYDSDTDRIYSDLREFFSRGVQTRGIAHKNGLKWTGRLTKLVVLFVLADIVLRASTYVPQPILMWLNSITT